MFSLTPLRMPNPRAHRLGATAADISAKKRQLLTAIAPLDRGLTADDEQKKSVMGLCTELEEMNPTTTPLESERINGQWELVYTTSNSILGKKRLPFLRPIGPIYQIIDAKALRARNRETWPLFTQVSADLTPMSKSQVKVQFDTFKLLGLIPVKAPPTALGTLDTTFLDEELRISRGDKGNIFVLTMNDPNVKP